jgi:hypothetical protein
VLNAVIFLEKLRTMLRLRDDDASTAHPELRPVVDEVATAWPFTDAAIDLSPAEPGVYLLYRGGRLIYIGLAVNGAGIRQELESHRRGAYGECTREATAFLYELARDPRALYRRYLAAHRGRYGGRLPAGNEPDLAGSG